MLLMTNAMRVQIDAVAALLVGSGPLDDGLAVCGGARLSADLVEQLAFASFEADCDVIYVTCEQRGAAAVILDLHVFAPRDAACHVFPACQLWLSPHGGNVAIVPTATVRGRFVIDGSEVVHVAGKPADERAGITRARRKVVAMAEAALSAPRHITH